MPITITKAGSVACLICALGSGACSLQVHDPKPLDPSLVQSQLLARDPDYPALRDVLNRRGVNTAQWPLRVWDVAALTKRKNVMVGYIGETRVAIVAE